MSDANSGMMQIDWSTRNLDEVSIKELCMRSSPDMLGVHVLCTRGFNCLWRSDIQNVGALVKKSRSDLAAIRGVGDASLCRIEGSLSKRGLSLRAESNSLPVPDEDARQPVVILVDGGYRDVEDMQSLFRESARVVFLDLNQYLTDLRVVGDRLGISSEDLKADLINYLQVRLSFLPTNAAVQWIFSSGESELALQALQDMYPESNGFTTYAMRRSPEKLLVDILGLSTRPLNALKRRGIYTIDQLVERSVHGLRRDVPYFGAGALQELTEVLAVRGLSLREDD